MAFKFNPFTGTLDVVNTPPASYIDGEVEFHGDLPVSLGSPAVDSAFLVRKGSGIYFLTRKPAGIWVRELDNGNLDDWKYAGTFSDLYRDANFRIINDADTSKEIAFSAASISSGQTRTITVPDKNVTLDDASDTRTPSSHTHTAADIDSGASAAGTFLQSNGSGLAPAWNTVSYEDLDDVPSSFTPDAHNHAAADVTTGTFDNARINFAAPAAIGSTTPAAGTFTTLAANNGTLTASAPALDISQTWNDSGTKFTTFKLNATNTASDSASILADFQVDGVSLFSVNDNGLGIDGATFMTFSKTFSSAVLMGGVWYVNNGVAFNVAASRGPLSCVVQLGANQSIGWSTANQPASANSDLRFHREGAGILGQRNGTNAQEFRLYNTWTNASNYEALAVKWAANVVSLGPTAGGSGGTVRELHISGLPTSDVGTGILWNDGGTVKVGT